jgi:hypothetical protein
VTTNAASAVVSGTDATSPMLPTSARTTSSAIVSDVTTLTKPRPPSTKSSNRGSAAPA